MPNTPTKFPELFRQQGLAGAHASLHRLLVFGELGATAESLVGKIDSHFNERQRLNALAKACAQRATKLVTVESLAELAQLKTAEVREGLKKLEEQNIIFILNHFPNQEGEAGAKIFFYHNGIRNGLVDNFTTAKDHAEIGLLWENWAIAQYHLTFPERPYWFWRHRNNEEIDLITEEYGQTIAYEAKWNAAKYVRIPDMWKAHYPTERFRVFNPVSFFEWMV